MDKRKIKKLLILNLPYFLVGLFATNLGEAWRLAEGQIHLRKSSAFSCPSDSPEQSVSQLSPVGFADWYSLRRRTSAGCLSKRQNAKKYRHNVEYGSARWGTAKDIEPFIAPKFEDNVILTKRSG